MLVEFSKAFASKLIVSHNLLGFAISKRKKISKSLIFCK